MDKLIIATAVGISVIFGAMALKFNQPIIRFNAAKKTVPVSDDAGKPSSPFDAVQNSCGKWHPGHYVQATKVTTPESLEKVLSDPSNYIAGVSIGYQWRNLEPKKDVYDFSEIESHLRQLRRYNKQLFIGLESFDRKFFTKDKPLPDYLYQEPQYDGGVVPTQNGGSIAILWNEPLMRRSNKLVEALGKKFDGDPNVEGIIFGESALSVNAATVGHGYNNKAYADALISRADSAKKAFPGSSVIMYMNWGPPELKRVIDHLLEVGVGMGGPDVIPDEGRIRKERTPAYEYYPKLAGIVPLGASVEGPTLSGQTPPGGKTPLGNFTMESIYDMGIKTLKLNYMFWVDYDHRNFKFQFTRDVLPYINSRKGEINSDCPTKK